MKLGCDPIVEISVKDGIIGGRCRVLLDPIRLSAQTHHCWRRAPKPASTQALNIVLEYKKRISDMTVITS